MRTLAAPALLVLALTLAGCTPSSPSATSTRTGSASSSATPTTAQTASPTASATPTTGATTEAPAPPATTTPFVEAPVAPAEETPAEAAPADATCETVLTDEEYASLASDGLVLNPEIFVLDEQMQSLLDGGGLGCYWDRGEGDVRVWYAQAARPADAWDAQKQALLGQGWTEIAEPVAGAIQAPTNSDDDYIPVLTFRDGVVHYASYADFLGSVKALQN